MTRNKWLTLLAVIGLGLAGFFLYQRSNTNLVIIKLDQNVAAKIQKQTDNNNDSLTGAPVVATFQTNFHGKLKKGPYILTTEDPTYEKVAQQFIVGPKSVKLDVRLNLAASILSESLPQESVSMDQVLVDYMARHSLSADSYSLQKGTLYAKGEWYGGLLAPKNGQDNLRIVFKKGGGAWTVATEPPDIILSTVVYPHIPKEILQAVNNL